MRSRIVQTVLVWLVSLGVAAALAAVPGMASVVILLGYLVALVVSERLSRRIRLDETEPRPDNAREESADWRTFLPAIFGTSAALVATDVSILDPPAAFLRALAFISTVAFGAFLLTDEVFRRRTRGA